MWTKACYYHSYSQERDGAKRASSTKLYGVSVSTHLTLFVALTPRFLQVAAELLHVSFHGFES
jgi:hypothetical protein